MTHNPKHYGPDASSDVESTCRNCDVPTTHPWEVCSKCYRDPNTNTCDGCGKPMYVQYPCVCGSCINNKAKQVTEMAEPVNDIKQPTVLKIEFSNRKAMEHFARWLCGSGEQEYWTWMECQESNEPDAKDITATRFEYFHHSNSTNFPTSDDQLADVEFVGDNTIRTTCGRLDNRDGK